MKEIVKNNMKIFAAFVKKEFKHIIRDKLTTFFLLIMPIMMLLLFGYAINTEVKNTNIAVLDPSNDAVTQEIVKRLIAEDYFTVQSYVVSPDKIDALFKQGKIGLAVVFNENFNENMLRTGEARVQLIADGSDPNTALTVTTYATAIISMVQKDFLKVDNLPLQIDTEVKLLYNPTLKSAYNFVPGVMGMVLLLICALMTSISIAGEKEKGTMEVLLVSPIKPIYMLFAKAVPYFLLSVINLTVILLIAVFIMGVPIAGSFFWLIVVSFVYIFLSLALGLLISSIVRSQDAAMIISGMVLMFPVILLSGMMFPIENMPWFFKGLSYIVPAKWYIAAARSLMIKGLGLSAIIPELIVLVSMATLLIVITLKTFKERLE
jgi:ABC-2 type transport system permease protein